MCPTEQSRGCWHAKEQFLGGCSSQTPSSPSQHQPCPDGTAQRPAVTAWGGTFPEEAPGGEKGGAGSHGAAGRNSKGCLWTLPGESCAVPCHGALERCPRRRAPSQQGAGRAVPPVPPRLPSWLQPGRATPWHVLGPRRGVPMVWQGCVSPWGHWGWWDQGAPSCTGGTEPGSLLCLTGRARCWQRAGDAEAGALRLPGQRGDLHQPVGGTPLGEHRSGRGPQDGWMGSLLLGQPLPSQPAWHRSVSSPASSRGHAGPRGQDVVAQRERVTADVDGEVPGGAGASARSDSPSCRGVRGRPRAVPLGGLQEPLGAVSSPCPGLRRSPFSSPGSP